jgi:alpha-tubulin suppressor-like RCC1 family protein
MSDSSVVCWGNNRDGQLGLGIGGNGPSHELPGRVRTSASGNPLLKNVKQLAIGGSSTCALIDDGAAAPSILCWGADGDGQLGDGAGPTPRNRPALNQPVNLSGEKVSIVQGQVISANATAACAVTEIGNVYCWGDGSTGQLGDGNATNAAFIPVKVSNLTKASTVAVGAYHSCAIRNGPATGNERVSCWGQRWTGSLGTGVIDMSTVSFPQTVLDATTADELTCSAGDLLAAGGFNIGLGGNEYAGSSCLVRNGDLHCWGFNGFGQLGLGDFDTRSKAADTSGVATSPLKGPPAIRAVQIGMTFAHTCIRATDRRVLCWGGNDSGELGVAAPVRSALPLAFPVLADDIAVGSYMRVQQTEDGADSFSGGYTCALDTTLGTITCFGENSYGQLGSNDATAKTNVVTMP